jgi:hypothetical protein
LTSNTTCCVVLVRASDLHLEGSRFILDQKVCSDTTLILELLDRLRLTSETSVTPKFYSLGLTSGKHQLVVSQRLIPLCALSMSLLNPTTWPVNKEGVRSSRNPSISSTAQLVYHGERRLRSYPPAKVGILTSVLDRVSS